MSRLICFVGFFTMLISVGSLEQGTVELWQGILLGILGSSMAIYGALKMNDEYEGN